MRAKNSAKTRETPRRPRAQKPPLRPGSDKAEVGAPKKRTYLSQSEVPAFSLTQAIRVPRAIGEHYGFKPTTPFNVAAALNMQPNSSTFRQLCGAAIAYGLTKGGYNAPDIAIEPLGIRIVRPTKEGDDIAAKREALLKPRVVGEFLKKYDGAPLPREDIGRNVLAEMGVPPDRVAEVQEMILEGAEAVGILRTIKDKRYVDLSGVPIPTRPTEQESEEGSEREEQVARPEGDERVAAGEERPVQTSETTRRVFVTHGKNRAFLDPIKKLLGFGELAPVVAVERPSVSQPVSDKVMNEMRGCGSAIIHVDPEMPLFDKDGKEQTGSCQR